MFHSLHVELKTALLEAIQNVCDLLEFYIYFWILYTEACIYMV